MQRIDIYLFSVQQKLRKYSLYNIKKIIVNYEGYCAKDIASP